MEKMLVTSISSLPTMFSVQTKQNFSIWVTLKLLNASNFVKAKILLSVIGLKVRSFWQKVK